MSRNLLSKAQRIECTYNVFDNDAHARGFISTENFREAVATNPAFRDVTDRTLQLELTVSDAGRAKTMSYTGDEQ